MSGAGSYTAPGASVASIDTSSPATVPTPTRWCPVKWWKSVHTIRELRTVYAIAARISWAVLDSDGVAVCCIDSALK